jgi:hypothetical protein
MPLTPIKFLPGLNSVKSPTLNQGGWTSGSGIRFFEGLPQKDGGFVQFTQVQDVPRSMRAWRALSGNYYLSVSGNQYITVFYAGQTFPITPLTIADQIPLSITTMANSTTVTINDTVNTPSVGQALYILGPVSEGGLVLFGGYIVTGTAVGSYTITSQLAATLGQTGGSVRQFTTQSGSQTVTISLPFHGLATGQVTPLLAPVTVGGITLAVGNYLVTNINPNQYSIQALTPATSVQTVSENGGQLSLIFFNPASGGSQNAIPALTTTSDNWGEFLMSCSQGGPINVWMPASGTGTPASVVATAPLLNNYIFVATQVQQLIVLGTTNETTGIFDPMLLRWSDIGDYTDFTPSVSNAAGSFRLAIGSQIQAGIPMVGQNLIWTDLTVYSMQYLSQPLIWGFQPLGLNCGAVGPHAVGMLGGIPFWMSQNQFYMLGAVGPIIIECPVWDQVFPGLDRANLQYVVCETDAFYGEVAWSVPQTNGDVIFVRLRPDPKHGDAWTASSYHYHTAWIDQNVFGAPIGGHIDGIIDQHDTGVNGFGEALPTSLVSGMILISEGSETTFVRDFLPDFNWLGTTGELTLYIYFYSYPTSEPRISGPYTITPETQVIHPRGRARAIQLYISGNDLNSNWRLGDCRYRGHQDGKR